MSEPVVFERRLPGGWAWLVVALTSWLLYIPALVVGVEGLRGVEAQFRGSQLEHAFAGTLIIGGAFGWFLLPLGWLLLWGRACQRYGRCMIGPDRVAFVQPAQVRRLVVEPAALRVVDCTRWGVVVEAEAWATELGAWRQPFRRTGEAAGLRLLIPCEEADHARVLAMLGAGPRS